MEKVNQALINIVGSNIKKIREEKNITRNELSSKINITVQAISQYENCKRLPSSKIQKELADALDVSINDLLSDNSSFTPTDEFYEWESFSDATQKFVRILDILGYQISLKADTVIINSAVYSLQEFEKSAQKVYGKISDQTIHEIGYINAVLDFMSPLEEGE